jgi:hypothetical protein
MLWTVAKEAAENWSRHKDFRLMGPEVTHAFAKHQGSIKTRDQSYGSSDQS